MKEKLAIFGFQIFLFFTGLSISTGTVNDSELIKKKAKVHQSIEVKPKQTLRK